jgi:hypothetical protein
MNRTVRLRTILILLMLAFIAMTVSIIALALRNMDAAQAAGREGEYLPILLVVVLAGTSLAMGALVVSSAPRNRIGWLFVFSGALLTVGALLYYVSVDAFHHRGLDGGVWVWTGSLSLPLMFMGMATFAMVMMLFPDGRLLGSRWRWAVWITIASMAAMLISAPFDESKWVPLIEEQTTVRWAAAPPALMTALGQMAMLLVTASFALAAIALFIRYRRGTYEVRQQVKWVALASALFATSVTIDMAVPGDQTIINVLDGLTLLLVSVAAGVAITKYRLYDIDILINRTLVYAPLTALVAGGYVAAVALAKVAFEAIIGHASDSEIVIATLVAGAIFWIARMRLTALVDRHFKDPREPARDLARLQATVRSHTLLLDPAVLSRERLASHVLASCVEAFSAQGGRLHLTPRTGEPLVIERGEGAAAPAVEVPIVQGERTAGTLMLGRRRTSIYTPRDVAALQAAMTGLAPYLDPS